MRHFASPARVRPDNVVNAGCESAALTAKLAFVDRHDAEPLDRSLRGDLLREWSASECSISCEIKALDILRFLGSLDVNPSGQTSIIADE